jgi:hypothetical protein
MIKRCKVCYGWINSKATRCKHCNSPINDDNRPPEEGFINYINSGFMIIEKECAAFEAKIDSMKGEFCSHHEYTEEELMHSSHIQNIKSIAEKISNDIAEWEAKKLTSSNVRQYYETKFNILRQKLNYMFERVKFRRKTSWDNIYELLLCSYYLIFNIAFYHFQNYMVSNILNNSQSKHNSPFRVFGQAANFFESFMNDVMGNYAENSSFTQKKNA